MLRQSTIPVISRKRSTHNPYLPTFPVECIAYIDSAEWWFPRELRRHEIWQLRRLFKGGKVVECRKPNGFLMGYRAGRNQPDDRFLARLYPIAQECGAVLCRLDIAVDCEPASDLAVPILRDTIVQQAVLNWCRRGPMQDFGTGGAVNWVLFSHASERRPNRNLSLYADRHNRFTGEVDCVHLELRFLRANIIRRQGIKSLFDLVTLDPKALFDKHLRWSADGEKFRHKVVKQAVLEDREYYRGKVTKPFTDQYRAAIPRRVKQALYRTGNDRSQVVKDTHPRRKLTTIPAPLNIPTALTWRAPT